MPKKKTALTIEERLQQALVPAEEQPYEVPENWVWVRLIGNVNSCLDGYRKPINSSERAKRVGKVPYYGATGQVGWIDDYLTNEHLVLLGEDGAPFLDLLKDKAYIISGEAWVNNHAHILKSYFGEIGNVFLMHYLNTVDYKDYVKGTTRLKLTQGSMQLMPFPFPPLSEQQRIVERIEELFAKLDEAKERLLDVADGFAVRKAAILHKAFTGELTKQWRRKNGVSDESWEEKKFDDCIEKMQNGLSKRKGDEGNNIGVLRLANLGEDDLVLDDLRYILLTEKEEKNYLLSKDDVIMIRVNGSKDNVARQIVINTDEKLAFCDHIIRIKYNLNIVARYVMYFSKTNAYRKYVEDNMVSSAGQNTISRKGLASLVIPLPSIEEQHEIVRLIDDLLARERAAQQAAEQALASIDLMKKSILARAFRGELGTNKASEASALELLRQVLAEG